MSDFKMRPTPEQCSDETINRLFDELKPAKTFAAVLDRVEEVMHRPPVPTVAELFFHTNRRRDMEFDRVPVGHSLGYRCYDGRKHDSESAFSSGEYGDGLTEDQAYVDWLRAMDDGKPKPRSGITVHSSPYEPPTVVDALYQDPDEE